MAVYFDLKNEIPEGATVLDAKFRIYRYDTWEKTHRVDGWYAAYKITNSSWVSQVTSTTYLKPWNNKGGDYTGEGADTIYNADITGWFDFEITSHVQDFVNEPSKNYGVILSVAMDNPNHLYNNSDPRVDTVAQMGKFHSMKVSEVSLRPQLVVTYTTDPTGSIIAQKNSKVNFKLRQSRGALQLYVPHATDFSVTVSDVRGRVIAVCKHHQSNEWVNVPVTVSAGMHVVTVKAGEQEQVSKITMIK